MSRLKRGFLGLFVVMVYHSMPTLAQTLVHADSATLVTMTRVELASRQNQGYLLANSGPIIRQGSGYQVAINLGPQFQWLRCQVAGVPADWGLASIRSSSTMSQAGYTRWVERMLSGAADNGYPYASLQLDSLAWPQSNIAEAKFRLQLGSLVVFDTMAGTHTWARQGFLQRYTGIVAGNQYSQRAIAVAEQRLKRLPYISLTGKPTVGYKPDNAQVTWVAKSQAANQLDGIVGFLPNEQAQGQLLVTGQVNVVLQNLFKSGHAITANWQSFKADNQLLQLGYQMPIMPLLPLSLGGNLHLLRQDSQFVEVKTRLELMALVGGNGRFGFFTQLHDTRVLTRRGLGKSGLVGTEVLTYGLKGDFVALDQLMYPKSGWDITAELGLGQRQFRLPTSATPTEKDSLRAGLQFSFQSLIKRYWPIGSRSTILTQFRVVGTASDLLVRNEQARLGGLQTLRGFNENFFFVSQAAVATAEYRFYWQEASYLTAFVDHAWLNTSTRRSQPDWQPVTGFGAGLSFPTPAGQLQVLFALGQGLGQVTDPQSAKLHVGLKGLF